MRVTVIGAGVVGLATAIGALRARRRGDASRALGGARRQRLLARRRHARALLRGRERAREVVERGAEGDRLVGAACSRRRAQRHPGGRAAARRRRDRPIRRAHARARARRRGGTSRRSSRTSAGGSARGCSSRERAMSIRGSRWRRCARVAATGSRDRWGGCRRRTPLPLAGEGRGEGRCGPTALIQR